MQLFPRLWFSSTLRKLHVLLWEEYMGMGTNGTLNTCMFIKLVKGC